MVLNTAASISLSQINSTVYFTNGNLGINTTNPSSNLDVAGTISASGLSALANVTATNMTSSTLIATTSVSSGLLSATNVIGNSISSGTLSATTITGANLSLSGNLNIAGTLTTVNITSTNLVQTNVSTGTIYASGTSTLQNVTATNISSSTLNATTTNNTQYTPTSTFVNNSTVGGTAVASFLTPNMPTNSVNTSSYFGKSLSVGNSFSIAYNYAGSNNTANSVLMSHYGLAGTISLLNNGNVGIGTTNPAYTLDVAGTSRITNTLNIGTNNSGIFTHQSISSNTNYPMIFCSNKGNLGSFLFTNGDASTGYVIINANSATLLVSGSGSFSGALLATNNSNTVGNIYTTGGNVGIGTTSPSGMLHLNGSALFTSTGNLTCTGDVISFGSLSDARLKKNIQTIDTERALDIVSKLRSVSFDWNDNIFNEEKRNTNDLGFIAQEVEALVPEAVSEYKEVSSGEVYKRIKHERLIPYLLTAIQYLLNKK
jgi:hypothetical protein